MRGSPGETTGLIRNGLPQLKLIITTKYKQNYACKNNNYNNDNNNNNNNNIDNKIIIIIIIIIKFYTLGNHACRRTINNFSFLEVNMFYYVGIV